MHYNLIIIMHWDPAVTVQCSSAIITEDNAVKSSAQTINTVKNLLISEFLVTSISLFVLNLDTVSS